MKRKLISSLLVVLMCFIGAISLSNVCVEAKGAPTLSAKAVTIAKGGRQTIKLKNGKGSWSIRGNGVAKISKKSKTSATITPVKAGSTVVTCKVGGKKLSCKVKVLNNEIGSTRDMNFPAVVVGRSYTHSFVLPKGITYEDNTYDKRVGKLSIKTKRDADTGETKVTATIKALKPGRFSFTLYYKDGDNYLQDPVDFVFINGFRGKTKASKTEKNYRVWRKKTLSTMVSADMSTWEIINAVGSLISTGKYSKEGGATGMQLWYGGNGTCKSGAMMMDDFMKDIGVTSKVKLVGGKQAPAKDIYGFYTAFIKKHQDTWITLGGERYELQPQPEAPWPIGTVKR